MTGSKELVKQFGIILPAVEEMMGERNLSCAEAIRAVWMFVSEILADTEPPAEILEAIERLSAVDDELELRFRT